MSGEVRVGAGVRPGSGDTVADGVRASMGGGRGIELHNNSKPPTRALGRPMRRERVSRTRMTFRQPRYGAKARSELKCNPAEGSFPTSRLPGGREAAVRDPGAGEIWAAARCLGPCSRDGARSELSHLPRPSLGPESGRLATGSN